MLLRLPRPFHTWESHHFGAFSSPARPAFSVRKAQLIFQPSNNNFRRSSWMEVFFFCGELREDKKKTENTRWKGNMDLKNGTKDHWSGYDGYVWSHDLQSGLWIDLFGTLLPSHVFWCQGTYMDATYQMMQIFAASRLFCLSLSVFGVFCIVLVASCIFQDMIGHGKEPSYVLELAFFTLPSCKTKQSSRREI